MTTAAFITINLFGVSAASGYATIFLLYVTRTSSTKCPDERVNRRFAALAAAAMIGLSGWCSSNILGGVS